MEYGILTTKATNSNRESTITETWTTDGEKAEKFFIEIKEDLKKRNSNTHYHVSLITSQDETNKIYSTIDESFVFLGKEYTR